MLARKMGISLENAHRDKRIEAKENERNTKSQLDQERK